MNKTKLIFYSFAIIFKLNCQNNPHQSTIKEIGVKNQDTMIFKSEKTEVTVEEAYELSKKGVLFIDVREPYEIAEVAYDVKNIKNIPLNEIESRLSEIPKNQPVILVCNRGRRSAEAREILKKHGYQNTMNMNGGILEWQRKKLPVIQRKK